MFSEIQVLSVFSEVQTIGMRFDQQDKRMDEMRVSFNQRFDQQDKRLDRMERKVDDIYEVRDRVTVGFSRAFAGVNIALVAFFVSMWR